MSLTVVVIEITILRNLGIIFGEFYFSMLLVKHLRYWGLLVDLWFLLSITRVFRYGNKYHQIEIVVIKAQLG